MKTVMSGDVAVKPKRMPPTLSLNEDDLPDIKDWKVGGKYTITLKVEQVSSSKDSSLDGPSGGSKKLEARFHVLSASASGKPVAEADDYEEETPEEEDDTDEETPEEDMGDMEDMMGGHGKGPKIAIIIRAAKKKLGVA